VGENQLNAKPLEQIFLFVEQAVDAEARARTARVVQNKPIEAGAVSAGGPLKLVRMKL
jgi:hypothetical protein